MISPPPRSPLFPYTTLFRSWWRAGQEAAGRILRDDAGSDLQLQLYRYDAADLVADAAIEHQEPDPGNTLDYPDRHRLLRDRKSTRLNSSHITISYAVFCLKK